MEGDSRYENCQTLTSLKIFRKGKVTLMMKCKLALLGDGNAAVVEDKRKAKDLIKLFVLFVCIYQCLQKICLIKIYLV